MQSPRIQLPESCPARWENMTPAQGGRFCSSCEKTVIDFSKMSAEEIGVYFKAHAATGFCGHFSVHQVDAVPKNKREKLLSGWYRKAEESIRPGLMRWFVLILLSGLITLSGCRTYQGKAGGWEYHEKDSKVPKSK